MGSKTSGDAVDSTQPLETETPTEPLTEPTETAAEAQAEPIATAPTNATPKLRSIAWDNFKRTEAGDRAKVHHCSTLISCKGKQGKSTSAMLNHLKRCKAKLDEVQDEERPGKKIKQVTLHNQPRRGSDSTVVNSFLHFDQPQCRKALAKWVVVDEMPLE
ncbi:Unknown protein [Striga hermonthica]|uniref:BED-type domain-containing protein n=1 Tax=Striga hermonthica TaxID=68872 RepID=A0A9N7NYZ4_STRHE|nr:Unknown protein [Striga hermonthica]